MAEFIKKEVSTNESEMTSTAVEDTCFVNLHKDEIKLENVGIQGKPDSFTLNKEF